MASLLGANASLAVGEDFTHNDEFGSCVSAKRTQVSWGGASVLPPHDAALDEHHDCVIIATLAVGAQAISSGCRKGLTLIEGLPVSRFHVVHHLAHAPFWLLGESRAGDADHGKG
jgi:hypothetical protein